MTQSDDDDDGDGWKTNMVLNVKLLLENQQWLCDLSFLATDYHLLLSELLLASNRWWPPIAVILSRQANEGNEPRQNTTVLQNGQPYPSERTTAD